MSHALGLAIGRTVDFKCNGMPNDRLIIVTSSDEYGFQEAISFDGRSHRTVSHKDLFKNGTYRGIGFYDTSVRTILSRYQVECIKLRRIEYGRKPAHIPITDLNGKIIRISNPEDALFLLPRFAHCPQEGESPKMMAMYARITAYWTDLLVKLQHHI